MQNFFKIGTSSNPETRNNLNLSFLYEWNPATSSAALSKILKVQKQTSLTLGFPKNNILLVTMSRNMYKLKISNCVHNMAVIQRKGRNNNWPNYIIFFNVLWVYKWTFTLFRQPWEKHCNVGISVDTKHFYKFVFYIGSLLT